MRINIPTISSSADLVAELGKIDISVPSRIGGRTTEHTEKWAICRLLSTLASANALAFPVYLQHRDRPDFYLNETSRSTGVEVTEAVTAQYAACCALAEREFPDALIELAHFKWGAPELSVAQMRELLRQDQLTGQPWVGDKPEQEWAFFMQSVVEAKLAKLARAGFQLYERNVLSVYDNLPLPKVRLQKGIDHLTPLLDSAWLQNPSFDAVYIEHGPVIVELTPVRSQNLTLNNLWP